MKNLENIQQNYSDFFIKLEQCLGDKKKVFFLFYFKILIYQIYETLTSFILLNIPFHILLNMIIIIFEIEEKGFSELLNNILVEIYNKVLDSIFINLLKK